MGKRKKIIEKTKTLTGPWWVFNGVTATDFDIEISDYKWDDFSGKFGGRIVYRIGKRLQADLEAVLGDDADEHVRGSDLHSEFFGHTPFSNSFQRNAEIEKRTYSDGAVETPKLKNVRREDTRQARIKKAEKRIKARLDPSGEWVRNKIAAFVTAFNEGVEKFVEKQNKATLDQLESTLSYWEPWAKFADEHGVPEETRSEIEELERQEAEIHAKLDQAYKKLQQERTKVWITTLESNGWKWKDKDEHVERKLPAPFIAKTKELAEAGKAFHRVPAHRRSFLLD